MTIQDGFQRIFDKAFSRVSFSIDSTGDFLELKELDYNSFRVVLFDELISFFAKEYNTDLLPMYLEYMMKCDNKHLNHFNKLAANEELF